jgi:hypothetical protein
VAVGSPDHLSNESWELSDGHMLAESVIVYPVGAIMGELDNDFIF